MWVSSHWCAAEMQCRCDKLMRIWWSGRAQGQLMIAVFCCLPVARLPVEHHAVSLPVPPSHSNLQNTLQQPWKQVKEKHHLKSWQQMHPWELPRHNAVYKSISISEDFDLICGEQCVFSLTGSVLHLVYLLFFCTLVLPRVHSKWSQSWNCLNVECCCSWKH